MPIHTRVFPAQITTDFSLFRSDALLKAHPRYAEAKAGSAEAAVEFISTIALSFIVQISEQLPSHACYVAPHAREATGDNAIPQVLAAPCASAAAGLIDTDIVQINRVFHTGAAPLERMAIRPDFEGIVNPDTDYVLADDVTTMGGTLAELANYTAAHEGLWKCSGMKVAGASRASRISCPGGTPGQWSGARRSSYVFHKS